MKHFSPMGLSAAIMLATVLAACGSSQSPTRSGAITANASNGNVTPTAGTNGSTTATGGTATVSVTGSLGGVAFTGKDAVYASDTLQGVTFVTAVVSDSANLCDAFSGTGDLDGNIVVIQLLTASGDALTVGDYTVEDSNNTTTTNVKASAGIASVGLLTSVANSAEIDASTGNVQVTAYSANAPLVFNLSAQATGSSTGITGKVSAPACAALATALQNSTASTTTKLAHARRVFISNIH